LLAHLLAFGRHTISSMLRAQNRHHLDWSADYRFYSQDRFDEDAVFDQIRRQVQAHLPGNQPLVAAMDDSLLRKTGRKIHGVRYLRDPLGPPFQVNFVRGLRVLQLSAALPQGGGRARMIPIDFSMQSCLPSPARTLRTRNGRTTKSSRLRPISTRSALNAWPPCANAWTRPVQTVAWWSVWTGALPTEPS
jgi:hypothetical protein